MWADSALGGDATRVAVATSVVVMVVNAGFATAVTPRRTLATLRGGGPLLLLLAARRGGALATRLAPAALTHWAFVAYTAVTLADVLLRPGFLRPRGQADASVPPRPLPALVGAPVGAVAAFLGVGGSVMTVPAMRRAATRCASPPPSPTPSPWPSPSPPPPSTSPSPPPPPPPPPSRTAPWPASSTSGPPRPCSSAPCPSSPCCAATRPASRTASTPGPTRGCWEWSWPRWSSRARSRPAGSVDPTHRNRAFRPGP
ncbi:TSUP family transporter [Actinomadura keratinilytica]